MEWTSHDLIAIGLILAGAGVAIHPFFMRLKIQRMRQWPTVKAKVVSSKVTKNDVKPRVYRAEIKYEYLVDSKLFSGRRIAVGGEVRASSIKRAQIQQAKYPVGSVHEVFYNPENPSEAYLEVKQEGALFTFLMGLVFFFLGLGILLGWIYQ